MTLEELSKAVSALDTPDATRNSMVYRVWSDGEVTCEKAGDLLGLRTLHMLAFGSEDLQMTLPNKGKKYSYIWCDRDGAIAASKLVKEACPNYMNRWTL